MKYLQYFGKRTDTFSKSYEIIKNKLSANENCIYNIVELGSSRSFVGIADGCMIPDIKYWNPSNPSIWDWGAGIFTKVFSENLKDERCYIYTVDPDVNANFIVTTMCNEYNNVKICQTYSSDFLSKFNEKIDFLYMDHMETSEAAAVQHYNDIKYILDNNLMSDNGVILIDDVGSNVLDGKGKYSIPYLLNNNYHIILHSYQVLLEKQYK